MTKQKYFHRLFCADKFGKQLEMFQVNRYSIAATNMNCCKYLFYFNPKLNKMKKKKMLKQKQKKCYFNIDTG